MKYHILFVCTGNSCRSPFAEGYLRKKSNNVEVKSRGVSAFPGISPPQTAVKVAKGFSVDISSHLSAPLSEKDLEWADLVLVFEPFHREKIRNAYPNFEEKVFLLPEFSQACANVKKKKVPFLWEEAKRRVSESGESVEDPIGGGEEDYKRVYGKIADLLDIFLGG
jgi:protein-tyrosine phosphatase